MIRFLTFLTVCVWLILGAGTAIYGLAVETGMLQSIRDMIAAVGCVVMAGFALRFGEWLHDRTVEFELQRTAALWQRNHKKPRPVDAYDWMSPYKPIDAELTIDGNRIPITFRSEDDTEPLARVQ